jgi:phage/plasmid-like protein (TIGR03299 family)
MLGTDIRNCQSVEEALAKSGLDWNIREESVITASGSQTNKKALIKASDNSVLGVVSKKYKPIGNFEVFSFIDSLLKDNQLELHSAGELKKGKLIFLNCKIGDFKVSEKDQINKYLILTNSFDGTSSLSMKFHNKRLVCSNQLPSLYTSSFRIPHNSFINEKLAIVKKEIDICRGSFNKERYSLHKIQEKSLNTELYQAYLEKVFEKDYQEIKEKNTLEYLFTNGRGTEGQSLYDGYNSITEYLTYNKGKKEDSRFMSNLSGDNFKIALKALEVALQW